MNTRYDQCLTFLNTELKSNARKPVKAATRFRAVTLSRDAGSGGNSVAEMLVERLRLADPKSPTPWMLFNRDLIEKVLEDHQVPKRLAKFFPEDRLGDLQDAMEEVVGLRPPSWTIVEQTSETIRQLAALGNVVIVGRAGNMATQGQPDVLRVRLTGSLERRVQRLMESQQMSRQIGRAHV